MKTDSHLDLPKPGACAAVTIRGVWEGRGGQGDCRQAWGWDSAPRLGLSMDSLALRNEPQTQLRFRLQKLLDDRLSSHPPPFIILFHSMSVATRIPTSGTLPATYHGKLSSDMNLICAGTRLFLITI